MERERKYEISEGEIMGDGLMGGAWISERTRETDCRVDALGRTLALIANRSS